MSVYLVCNVRVDDPETYSRYTARTPDIIRQYGGRFVVRGGDVAVIRMESFLADPEGTLDWLCAAYGLTRKHADLKTVKARLGNRFNTSVDGYTRPDTPDALSPRDMGFLRAQLDLTLESQLGYTYD